MVSREEKIRFNNAKFLLSSAGLVFFFFHRNEIKCQKLCAHISMFFGEIPKTKITQRSTIATIVFHSALLCSLLLSFTPDPRMRREESLI